MGEGEEALGELVEHMDSGRGYTGVDNIWYKQNGDLMRTPLRPLQPDLDAYPYPDYDLDNEFVLHQGHIQAMTPDLLLYYLRFPYTSESVATYSTMMSRGCTYNCAYCCNNALRGVYHTKWHVRRRSVGNIIGELKQIVTRFPGIQSILIGDDVFIVDLETLREFRDAYKKEVNIPLFISGFQPPMIDEETIGLLVDAGMKQIRVGIQTGSMRSMQQIYHRPVKREHIQRTFAVLHQFTDRIEPPIYDFILDNPWETEEDQLETLYLLLDIPKPYQLYLFSLTFYPGTHLYDRAKREGILQDDLNQVYRKFYLARKRTYLNGLFDLFQSQQAPRWLMSLLLHQNVRRLNLVWLPYLINGVLRVSQLSRAGWRALRRRDWAAFTRALRARGWLHISRLRLNR